MGNESEAVPLLRLPCTADHTRPSAARRIHEILCRVRQLPLLRKNQSRQKESGQGMESEDGHMKNILSPLKKRKKSESFPAWRSVGDCLPEKGTYVLAVVDGTIQKEFYLRDGHWLFLQDGAVTHWMPLPPLPKEERIAQKERC